jgi:hypothetical protein
MVLYQAAATALMWRVWLFEGYIYLQRVLAPLHLFGVSWYTQRGYKKSGGDGVETRSQVSIDIIEY